jgi:hypothetical protein
MSSPVISTLALLGDFVFVDVLVDDARHRLRAGRSGVVPPSRCGMLLVKQSTCSA